MGGWGLSLRIPSGAVIDRRDQHHFLVAIVKSRFRFRFSVRTLAIFVTLVCAYFGAWEATKRYGVPPKSELRFGGVASSPAPFLIRYEEDVSGDFYFHYERHYYIWFFGLKIKLPLDVYSSDSTKRTWQP